MLFSMYVKKLWQSGKRHVFDPARDRVRIPTFPFSKSDEYLWEERVPDGMRRLVWLSGPRVVSVTTSSAKSTSMS
jgi:hypothetical protein